MSDTDTTAEQNTASFEDGVTTETSVQVTADENGPTSTHATMHVEDGQGDTSDWEMTQNADGQKVDATVVNIDPDSGVETTTSGHGELTADGQGSAMEGTSVFDPSTGETDAASQGVNWAGDDFVQTSHDDADGSSSTTTTTVHDGNVSETTLSLDPDGNVTIQSSPSADFDFSVDGASFGGADAGYADPGYTDPEADSGYADASYGEEAY